MILSLYHIEQNSKNFDVSAPDTVTTVVVEGTRAFLVEIQALTSKTFFGYPKRAASGFKKSRLELLIAILSKRLGLHLGEQDVYLNVAGGLKIGEPAADLAAVCAIIPSFHDKPLPLKVCVFGEVGLGGVVKKSRQQFMCFADGCGRDVKFCVSTKKYRAFHKILAALPPLCSWATIDSLEFHQRVF